MYDILLLVRINKFIKKARIYNSKRLYSLTQALNQKKSIRNR